MIRVSDHAIVRYLERKYNLDIDSIRKEILPDYIRDSASVGLRRYYIEGVEFIIENDVVVTGYKRATGRNKTGDISNKHRKAKHR